MADLVRLAYYPFLPGVRDALREFGPDVAALTTARLYADVRRRAATRVAKVLGDGVLESPGLHDDADAVHELLSQAVVRMLLSCLGDRILASRYAAREAARMRRLMRGEDDEVIQDILDTLGIPLASTEDAGPSAAAWAMHFADVLQHAPKRDEWKLVLRTVDAGVVPLKRRDLEQLAEEAIRRDMESRLHEEIDRGAPDDLKEALSPYIEELKPELDKAKENWNTGDFGPVKTGAFPPCIDQLFEQMMAGAMVPHHGRFAFASFLGTIGMSADQILDHMAQLPNFRRDKSEYQIRHIAGELSVEAYTPPSCATMQTNGICPLDRRDEICHRIKHPLHYYRIRKKQLPDAVDDGAVETGAPKGDQTSAAPAEAPLEEGAGE